MTPAELLALTGRLAPILRGKRPRTVKVVDADGKVVRVIDDAKVAEKLLERQGIEVSLSAEAERLYREKHCKNCDKELKGRGTTGQCRECANRARKIVLSDEEIASLKCKGPGCDNLIGGKRPIRRRSRPGLCRACSARAAATSKSHRLAQAKISKGARSEASRRGLAALPAQDRSDRAKHANRCRQQKRRSVT